MTDPKTDVSEAEVKAGAEAVRWLGDEAIDPVEVAHDVLTAAAQARGREDESDVYACLAYAKLQKVEIERLRSTLQSIADNTCCDKCQEAAKWARAALSPQSPEPSSGPDVLGIPKGEE